MPEESFTGLNIPSSVTYSQIENLTPVYAYPAIIRPDGNKLWKSMTIRNITRYNRIIYNITLKLPSGTYSYHFQFKGAGVVVKTGAFSGPTVN